MILLPSRWRLFVFRLIQPGWPLIRAIVFMFGFVPSSFSFRVRSCCGLLSCLALRLTVWSIFHSILKEPFLFLIRFAISAILGFIYVKLLFLPFLSRLYIYQEAIHSIPDLDFRIKGAATGFPPRVSEGRVLRVVRQSGFLPNYA